MTDADVQAAKTTLEVAIRDFFAVSAPGEFVTGWVLITHRVSDELDADESSTVSRVVPTGQRFHVTRGLLDVALTSERQR